MQQNDHVKDPTQQRNPAKICPNCGHENAITAQRCANCEKRLPVVTVPQLASPSKNESLPVRQDQNEPSFVIKIPLRERMYQERRWVVPGAFVLITIIVLVSIIAKLEGPGKTLTSTPRVAPPNLIQAVTHQALPNGLGEVIDSHGHNIGINDGSFVPFDSGRPTELLKQQAAQKLKAGDAGGAIALWQEALKVQSNDAEALIYSEDQAVLSSGKAYITLVAGTAFTTGTKDKPVPDGSYESILQGIYVAQHEFNAENHPFQVRILVANSGSDVDVSNTTDVANQIVQIARQDTTIVGVIGWLHSENTLNAKSVLAKANLPLISPQSTTDELTRIASPYFFRVVAPNKREAQVVTHFAEGKPLYVKNVVIFVDPEESFSQNLAQDIQEQFSADGVHVLHEEHFTTDADTKTQSQTFTNLLNDAAHYHPDALIFTGRSNPDTKLFQDALPIIGPLAHTKIVAGSGSYNAEKNSYGRWYFISVAYHGTENTPIAQKFQQEYSADFNAHNQKPGGYYGYTLADDHAIVAYDATAVTLQAILNSGKTNPISQDLMRELPKITGVKAFQGVSGQIAFDANGNPMNKAFTLLFVAGDGHIQPQLSH